MTSNDKIIAILRYALETENADYLETLVGLLQKRIEMDRIAQQFLDANPPRV